MRYLVGIDNGGTFSKVAVFDEKGNQCFSYSMPAKVITPKPGYTERDMDELWESNVTAIRKTITESKIEVKDIAAVSLTGHGKGLYLLGKNGKPACHGILSTDTRAWKQVKAWYENGTSKKVYKKTKQEILACQPVSLLAWFRDHEPEVLEQIKYIFSVKDYVRYMLTGEAHGEYTDFSGGNLINLTTGQYDLELLKLFDLEMVFDKLPPLRRSTDICGYITKEAAVMTGLPEGIPVAAGMFDVNACGIASGLLDEEKMCMIAGTWSINEFITKHPIDNGTVALNSMFCIPGYFLVEESSPTSAGNLEWFIRNIMDSEESGISKQEIYEKANAWVESIEPQNSMVIFLPFLNGSNEEPLAKGSFIGLTAYHKKKHLLRAVYEGIVFSHFTHVKKLILNREKPNSMFLSGGAANSDVWVQIFADVMQVEIAVIKDKELGAQGAAMAAGIAAGMYKDYQDAGDKTISISKVVKPRPEYKQIYEEKYAGYRTVVEALNPIWYQFENVWHQPTGRSMKSLFTE